MIKWEDIKIAPTGITNRIVLGKTKKLKNGAEVWTDKSEDKTDEVVGAVADYLLAQMKEKYKGLPIDKKYGFTWDMVDGRKMSLYLEIKEKE